MDYGTRNAASSATGYIGAAVTGILSGWLTDAWGWDATFICGYLALLLQVF